MLLFAPILLADAVKSFIVEAAMPFLLKDLYEDVSRKLPEGTLLFLNYGSVDTSGERYSWLRPADQDLKYHMALVRNVLAGIPLAEKSVLEVGCGRGGNLFYLRRYTEAKRLFGVDLSQGNAAFCRRFHGDEIPVARGDAQHLPFADAAVEVVLNLESSHCYPDFGGFLAEAFRVLKPGGCLAYADFWDIASVRSDWEQRAAALRRSPFEVKAHFDITEPVCQALTQEDGLSGILARMENPENRDLVRRLVESNRGMSQALASGDGRYLVWHLSKPV